MAYSEDWSKISFTYHQSAKFIPERSCDNCSLTDAITSINRGYLQFLAAGQSEPVDPETATIYQMMPLVLFIVRSSITSAISLAEPNSPTIEYDSIGQWTDCSYLLDQGIPQPYLASVPLPPGVPAFPFDPELCAFISEAMEEQYGVPMNPTDFASFDLALNYSGSATFLSLAIGQTNMTYIDPVSVAFCLGFLTATREQTISEIAALDSVAANLLDAITPTQWSILQGYLANLVSSWGALTMSQWLESRGGGLVLSQPLDKWLYGQFISAIYTLPKALQLNSLHKHTCKTFFCYIPFH